MQLDLTKNILKDEDLNFSLTFKGYEDDELKIDLENDILFTDNAFQIGLGKLDKIIFDKEEIKQEFTCEFDLDAMGYVDILYLELENGMLDYKDKKLIKELQNQFEDYFMLENEVAKPINKGRYTMNGKLYYDFDKEEINWEKSKLSRA